MIEGDELTAYLRSLAEYTEIKDITSTAFHDGKIKGKAEGEKAKAIDIAKAMLTKGFDVETIAEITKLRPDEIEALK